MYVLKVSSRTLLSMLGPKIFFSGYGRVISLISSKVLPL